MSQRNDRQELITSSYQIIANRRVAYDTLLWQVPSISFAAQAFLFTIALGTNSFVARLISASLAFVNAIISMQLMSKHRYHETIDARLLEKFEKKYGLNRSWRCAPHSRPKQRAQIVNVKSDWIVALPSFQLWKCGLMFFAGASIVVIIISFIDLFTHLNLL